MPISANNSSNVTPTDSTTTTNISGSQASFMAYLPHFLVVLYTNLNDKIFSMGIDFSGFLNITDLWVIYILVYQLFSFFQR